jgi:hypothetical protein
VERVQWTAEALQHLNDVVYEHETSEVIQGATLMHEALEELPWCFVAILNGELVGAVGFVVRPDRVGGTAIGTKQGTSGASWALQYEVARVAYDHGLHVIGYYTGPHARTYHLRIGRRLDESGTHSSEWTVEDCRDLVRGLKNRI